MKARRTTTWPVGCVPGDADLSPKPQERKSPCEDTLVSRALAHLTALRDYIAQDSPGSAASVAGRIPERVDLLSRHPEIGRAGRITGTRELVVSGTPYFVPYRLRRDGLELIAVFHSRQKWPKKL